MKYQKAPADGLCTYVATDGTRCTEPYKASGFCAGHWRRAKMGQDMDPPIRSFRRADTEFRFWRFIDKQANGCWLWTGCRETEGGYGLFYDGRVKRSRRAHVVMWEIANGKAVPKGLVVRHSCDVPECVRPEHLLLGTHGDNVRDKVERGRCARGADNPASRLNDTVVAAIRAEYADGATQRELADRYGVIQQTISQIVNRKTWTHI